MAQMDTQKKKIGNKHGSNVHRSERKYGKQAGRGTAKMGARATLHNRQEPGDGLALHMDSEGSKFPHTRVPADFIRR